MGIDLAPDLSFGLAVGYAGGTEDIRLEDGGAAAYQRNYSGFNIEPSLMFKIRPRLKAGLSLVLWEKFWNLEEVYEEKGVGNSEENYQVRDPFQLKTGLSYQGDTYLVAADARLNGWSQYRYGATDASSLEKTGYRDEMILSVGAEKYFSLANAVLRAGYTLNTLPETAFDPTYSMHRVSGGVGFLFSGALAMDLAYSYAFWGMSGDGVTVDNREHRALLTLAYRY
jgi:long-subunit fatty acid transport protein